MREIHVDQIIKTVRQMCIDANCNLNQDVEKALQCGLKHETNPIAKSMLTDILANADIARKEQMPICQDTGMVIVFVEIGQDVHIVGGDFEEAINQGVKNGYINGLLRKSIVNDPLNRVNTQDNTPAIIHTKIVKGDSLKLTVAPKGFGSENMSQIKMLNPSANKEDIIKNVLDIIKTAGANACPPMIIGIGIGGDFEYCAYLAKKALCRDELHNQNEYYSCLEDELLTEINNLNIGPQGFGGNTTALKVNIEYYPTHIAGLPIAVNIGCHVTRHKTYIF